MSATWRLARSGARAHLPSLVGPFVVLALAGVLVSGAGVLVESGLRTGGDAGFLVALASSFSGTALLLVIFVVSSTVSLALRQRQRDFALLRAVGATRGQVRQLVSREVTLITLVAAPLGGLVGLLAVGRLTPILESSGMVDPGFELSLSPVPVLSAFVLLLPVAYLAARLATRGTLRTSPTAAVAQSVVEPAGIGPVRRTSALVVAGLGLAAAFSPLFVPGTMGAALAAVSAFLLIGAAALAGPVLVAWLVRVLSRLPGGPATQLALANTRGFSRRLTLVVVPLALALGVGTVQATVDETVAVAGTRQLEDGLKADAIVTGDLDAATVEAVSAAPGVDAVVPLTSVPAQVMLDEEDAFMGSLAWEPLQVRALPAAGVDGLLDPDVVDGSLAALGEPNTVAISRDAKFEAMKGIGDELTFRWDEGKPVKATIVAIYDRGLGFGNYLTGDATPAAHGVDVRPDTLLLRTSDAGAAAVADLGVTVTDEQEYVASAVSASDGQRDLSAVLLLCLLVFVLVAAANALVLATAGRRDEFTLLWRTGATRRQLRRMLLVESLAIAVCALLIGTVAIIPAVIGVSAGLLGVAVPPVAWPTYGALATSVLATSILATRRSRTAGPVG